MGPTHWIFIWDTEWNAVSVFSARFITIAGDGWRYFVEAAWNAMGFVAGREATVAGRATGVILTAENEAIEPTLHYVLGEVKVWPFDTPPLGPGFNQRYEAVMKAIEEIAAKQGRRVAPEGFLNVKLLGPGGLAAIASNIVASMAMEEISEARLNTLRDESGGLEAFADRFRRVQGSYGVSGTWGLSAADLAKGSRDATRVFNAVIKANGGSGSGASGPVTPPASPPVIVTRPPSSRPTYSGGSPGSSGYRGGAGTLTYGGFNNPGLGGPYGSGFSYGDFTPTYGGSSFVERSGPGGTDSSVLVSPEGTPPLTEVPGYGPGYDPISFDIPGQGPLGYPYSGQGDGAITLTYPPGPVGSGVYGGSGAQQAGAEVVSSFLTASGAPPGEFELLFDEPGD